jgi:Kdo2-lipid IVA lauroyltransferase/acyltransferase
VLPSLSLSVPIPTRLRRGLRGVALRGLVAGLAFLPLRPALHLASLVNSIGWRLARGTRRRMLSHLELAFPVLSLDERESLGRRSLRHLAWLVAEMLAVRSYDARLDSYVSFAPGAEANLREIMAAGRGLVMVSGHVGHWELLARRLVRAGIPCATVARSGTNPLLHALLARFRDAGKFEVLLREDRGTARAIIRCLKQGKLLGLLIDQDTSVQGVFVPFFGRLAFTPRAAGDLALRFRAPVAVIWSRRRGPHAGDGHELSIEVVPYNVDAADREAESVRITAACTATLEAAIRARPEEWVWMHERWKTRPGATPA